MGEYNPTTNVPTAAAICVGPEELPINNRDNLINAASCFKFKSKTVKTRLL